MKSTLPSKDLHPGVGNRLARSHQFESCPTPGNVQLASCRILQRLDVLKVGTLDEVDGIAQAELEDVLDLAECSILAHGERD